MAIYFSFMKECKYSALAYKILSFKLEHILSYIKYWSVLKSSNTWFSV